MNTRTLFLAWQDKKERSSLCFPVGRLDADVAHSFYRFRYTVGATVRHKKRWDFPDLWKDYKSSEFFPLFRNRVIAPERPDRAAYLHNLGLPEDADPIEILSVNGGSRMTDNYEVFPKIEKQQDGAFRCRFFLHGWRHTNDKAQERLADLHTGEPLSITIELTNPATTFAVQIQTKDYDVIGWAPRYLFNDLVKAMAHAPGKYRAHVVKVNPVPAPSKQRVLIELSGHWPQDHEPMSSDEFQLWSDPE